MLGCWRGAATRVTVEFAGAVYQVMTRGNERRYIFRDDRDRKRFLETLGETPERFGVRVLAYCLMPNHVHLVLDTPRANLSQAMGAGFAAVRWRIRGRRCAGENVRAKETLDRVRRIVAQVRDRRLQIWARVRRWAERGREVAKAFGYRDGSRVTQAVNYGSSSDPGQGSAAKSGGVEK